MSLSLHRLSRDSWIEDDYFPLNRNCTGRIVDLSVILDRDIVNG